MLLLLLALSGCAQPQPMVPMNEPIALPDIELGPGDEIEIKVYRQPDLTRLLTIDSSGSLFFPLADQIDTRGATPELLRQRITDGLQPYFVDPQVSVEVKTIRSRKVIVLGEVARPGVYTMYGPMRALEAIGMAGGFGISADRHKAVRLREKDHELVSEIIDFNMALKKGLSQGNPRLASGDIVYVPPTMIADMARFSQDLERIIRPILLTETGILLGYDLAEAFRGERDGQKTIVVPFPGSQ